MRLDLAGRVGLLLERPGPQGGPVDAAPPRHQRVQVDLGHRARAHADHRDAPADREPLEVGRHVRRPDELRTTSKGPCPARAVGCDDGGAERGDGLAEIGVAHGGGDPGAGHHRELHPRGADASGGAVHERRSPIAARTG